MSKKTRYFLLLIGLVLFLALAPLIVLYVRGITYDFSKKAFVKTGIMAVRSDPKTAQIYINGKLRRSKEGDIKFLRPAEYDVEIKKEGYHSWSKRLPILPEQVTWASPAYNKISLLLAQPMLTEVDGKVLDLASQNSAVTYLTQSQLKFTSGPDFSKTSAYQLPEKLFLLAASDDSLLNFVLSGTGASYYFSKAEEKFYSLSGLIPPDSQFQFDSQGSLFALNKNSLYKVNPQAKSKTLLFANVLAYTFQDNRLYFVVKTADGAALKASPKPFGDSQTLMSGLPAFQSVQIKVTFEKQVFLLADGTLYLANSNLEKIADNVSTMDLNQENSTVTVLHAGQLDYYDPISHNLNYVTRSGEKLTNPKTNPTLGYVFFIKNNKLAALELDTRDRQNEYELYSGETPTKFFMDRAGQNILLLDGNKLKNLTIR